MRFTGELKELSVSELLKGIASRRISGILALFSEGVVGRFSFFSGRLVYANSESHQRLGGYLVQKNIISDEELNRALQIQERQKYRRPIATVLLELGRVYPEVLEEATEDHIREVLRDMLSWEDGFFHFEPTTIERPKVLRKGLSIESLLEEATAVPDDQDQPVSPS